MEKRKGGKRKMNKRCKKQSEGPGDEASFERMAQRKRGNIIMQRNPTVNTFTRQPRLDPPRLSIPKGTRIWTHKIRHVYIRLSLCVFTRLVANWLVNKILLYLHKYYFRSFM